MLHIPLLSRGSWQCWAMTALAFFWWLGWHWETKGVRRSPCISGGVLSFRTKLVSISNVAHVQPCIEAQKCMHLDMCTHIHTDANVTCPKALRVQHWIWVNYDVLGCSNLLAWMVSKVLLNWSASFLEWFVTGLPSVGAMLNATMNRQQLVAQDVTLRDRPGESSHVEGIHS